MADLGYLLVWGGESMLDEGKAKTGATDGSKKVREEENALLLEDGFKLAGSDDLLWVKECVCYGREAALQAARRR
jgi:hypothetical protein